MNVDCRVDRELVIRSTDPSKMKYAPDLYMYTWMIPLSSGLASKLPLREQIVLAKASNYARSGGSACDQHHRLNKGHSNMQ
jgi:hypothetical protein